MRRWLLAGAALAAAMTLAACGNECGDGTREEDGACVADLDGQGGTGGEGGFGGRGGTDVVQAPQTLHDWEIGEFCREACLACDDAGLYAECQNRCEVRATGLSPVACQTCMIDSFFDYCRDRELVAASQATCGAYCADP